MSSAIDHLVYATPDLAQGIEQIEDLLGLSASPGGSHPGMGTRNALFGLGEQCYLEVIGPDPEQVDFQGSRPFQIDELECAQLQSWAARRPNLVQFIQNMRSISVQMSDAMPLSRQTESGELVHWQLSFLAGLDPSLTSVLPFFIDWGSTPSPSTTCQHGATLSCLKIVGASNPELTRLLRSLELEVSLDQSTYIAAGPHLVAEINSPNGLVVLSSQTD